MTSLANGRYLIKEVVTTDLVLCKDKNLDRTVSIQWVTPTSGREAVRSRLAALQTVHSPYIALIYDIVEDKGRIGVVEEELSSSIQITKANRFRRLYEFCAGLAALHEHEIAHGALKMEAFCLGPLDAGRLCKLAFQVSPLCDPSVDRQSFASCLDAMGADMVDDPTFQALRTRIASSSKPLRSFVQAFRDRLAALLLRDRHRALLLWRGKSTELGVTQRSARFAHPVANVASVKVEYDGTRFFLAEVQGEVRVNNSNLDQGADLPKSCVIALGDNTRPWNQRYFITFDQSHPEVP